VIKDEKQSTKTYGETLILRITIHLISSITLSSTSSTVKVNLYIKIFELIQGGIYLVIRITVKQYTAGRLQVYSSDSLYL